MRGFVLPSPYRCSVTVSCWIPAQHFHHACQLQPVLLPLSLSSCSSASMSLAASGLTVHLPTHKHTHTHTHTHTVGVGAACLLSECINIYLASCPMSPVNTLLSQWNAIITSSWRAPLSPKVTAEHISMSAPLPCVLPPPRRLVGWGDASLKRRWWGDLGFPARAKLPANFLFIPPRRSQGLLLH